MSRLCPELYNMSSSLVQPNCSFGKTNRTANEIYKSSLAALLQIDYNCGAVFPVSALISATKTPLVLFLERVVAVWQLGVSAEAWCVVSLLDVTFFRACYSFLICFVKVVLSLCFVLSFPQSFLSVPRSSRALLFSPFLFPFFSARSAGVIVAEVSQRRWKDPVLMQAGQTLPYHGQRVVFFSPLINQMWFTLKFWVSFGK